MRGEEKDGRSVHPQLCCSGHCQLPGSHLSCYSPADQKTKFMIGSQHHGVNEKHERSFEIDTGKPDYLEVKRSKCVHL